MWGRVAAAAAVAVVLGTAALYNGLITRSYALSTGKWPKGSGLRFVVLSDLHSREFGEGQRKLLRLVEERRPDFILLPGDILDERRPGGPVWGFLRGAAGIAPTFYSPGNHEYRSGRMPEILSKVERCGVAVLVDGHQRLETAAGELILAGCADAERACWDSGYSQECALEEAFAGVDAAGAYAVLLAHRPERHSVYRRFPFDLVVSGHAHGGQVRVPFLVNGLYASGQGLFPRYAGGLYDHGGMMHLVSRGLSGWPPIPRVFAPPEITVLDVQGSGHSGIG